MIDLCNSMVVGWSLASHVRTSLIIDWSNRIIGYLIDSRMMLELALAAVRNAVALHDVDGTILHSHGGSQFRSRKFFALLQKKVLDKKKWRTRQADPDRVRDIQFRSRLRGLKTPTKTTQLNRQAFPPNS